jgi:hypothetical protein
MQMTMLRRRERGGQKGAGVGVDRAGGGIGMTRRRAFTTTTSITAACTLGLLFPTHTSPLPSPSPSLLLPRANAAEQARRPAKGEIEAVLQASEEELWPDASPPYLKSDFARLDETDDGLFYDTPKVSVCVCVCVCVYVCV